MTTTDPLRRLPIPIEDFLGLKANAQDRDRNLRLTFLHTDIGEDFISVEVSRPPIFPGFPTEEGAVIATIIRSDIMGHDGKPKLGGLCIIPRMARYWSLTAPQGLLRSSPSARRRVAAGAGRVRGDTRQSAASATAVPLRARHTER